LQVGFNDPVAVGTIIAGVNFFFTFMNLILVDRAGRRRILLLTVPGTGAFLVIAAVAFKYIPINHDLSLNPGIVV
jgi:MFS transporter, SP family, solute carrier family 2 (myo-inositol transporter), member 13